MATYGKNSFRSKDLRYRRIHFDENGELFRVRPHVRHLVTFRLGNLIDPWLFLGGQRFDAIFCRNVLIYLTTEAQQTVLTLCRKLLQPGGVLFVGPTEIEMAKAAGFRAEALPSACALKLIEENERQADRSVAGVVRASDEMSQKSQQAESVALFENASKLANQGETEAAISACHRYLALYPPTADIYFLLGILEVSCRHDREAESCFQKAIYLQPSHYEGLVNLALLAERRGEKREAEQLWKRARKIHQETADT